MGNLHYVENSWWQGQSLKTKDNTANHTQGQERSDRDLPHTASDFREMDKPAMACFGPIVCGCWNLNGNGRSRGNRNLLARGSNPSVTAARQGLNEARMFGRVHQCLTESVHRLVETVIEVHECIGRPEFGLKLFSRYKLALTLEQNGEYLKRLSLQGKLAAFPAEFTSFEVNLKVAKSNLVG
jgi:hypothetical protein